MSDPLSDYLNALAALEKTLVSSLGEAINPANVYAFPPMPTASSPLALPCIWNDVTEWDDPGTSSSDKGGFRMGHTSAWYKTTIYLWLAPYNPQIQWPNLVPWLMPMKI